MSHLRWFFGHTILQWWYAVRYHRERREMRERVRAQFRDAGIDYDRDILGK